MALWWWSGENSNEQLTSGEVTTDDKGEFEISLPFIFPKENKNARRFRYYRPAQFYNFNVEAKVTDVAGETREGVDIFAFGYEAQRPLQVICLTRHCETA